MTTSSSYADSTPGRSRSSTTLRKRRMISIFFSDISAFPLDPTDNEPEYIKDGCQEDFQKRTAEKIPFGDDDVAEQQYQANREKEDRLEQKVAVCQSQVAIHSTEQEKTVAMACTPAIATVFSCSVLCMACKPI